MSETAPTILRSSGKGYAGPRSRTKGFTPLDQRTKEARLLRETRAELVAHLGGKVSATQAATIERACQLMLRLAQMDRKYAQTGEMTEHDSRTYLAWSNTLTRTVREIGFKSAAQRPQSLRELLDDPAPAAPRSEA